MSDMDVAWQQRAWCKPEVAPQIQLSATPATCCRPAAGPPCWAQRSSSVIKEEAESFAAEALAMAQAAAVHAGGHALTEANAQHAHAPAQQAHAQPLSWAQVLADATLWAEAIPRAPVAADHMDQAAALLQAFNALKLSENWPGPLHVPAED